MDPANEDTVLGDFNNAEFEYFGFLSRFYRKKDKFFVYTRGPDGKPGDFEVTHVFGCYPLQQYLIPFPGGRLQCLPIAWDVKKASWYHLYPEAPIDPKDWMYWTNASQNWNGMCAECHSTNLQKNFDPEKNIYNTTWSDIDVGCEACHGSGSLHVEWAQLPAMGRPFVKNDGLPVKTSGIASRELVEVCAPCHSRRSSLGDYTHAQTDLLDSLLPASLTSELYFPDGQIRDEVYVYGSFTQSKMYHRDVHCSDCHDVHSAKRLKEGNALCLQCHRADEYDQKAHHFHKLKGEKGKPIRAKDGSILFEVGTGAECVGCHMPGRMYMGIDYRSDHSFRIPRPDLSRTLMTPNACNRCHNDKDAKWADDKITEWYGPGRRSHYGTIIHSGRNREPGSGQALVQLSRDTLYPVIVRATAISLLQNYPGHKVTNTLKKLLADDEAFIRRAAIVSLQIPDPEDLMRVVAPLLYDPVKAVRIEAANKMAGEPATFIGKDQQQVFENALKEFEKSMVYSADFAAGQHNLGNLYIRLNRPEEAISSYKAAVAIDDLFYPAKVNLAMIYNQSGENDRAEKLLREVVAAHPETYEIIYSLGLLLVEKKEFNDAIDLLQQAAEGLPHYARIHYNLGLLLQRLNRYEESEVSLLKAHKIEVNHFDYLYALADFYLKRNSLLKARIYAELIAVNYPKQSVGHDLLLIIKRSNGQK